jgi:hypothetical protein
MTVSPLERLTIIEDIKQMRARFVRCLDTKDWAGFAALWAPDGTMDAREEGEAGGLFHGPDEITAFVSTALQNATTVHHLHAPEIEVLSLTSARGVWAMEDRLRWLPVGGSIRELTGYGHYNETYEMIGGRWVIKTLQLTRLRVDFT